MPQNDKLQNKLRDRNVCVQGQKEGYGLHRITSFKVKFAESKRPLT